VQAGNNWVACYERDGTLVWQARLHEEVDCDIGPYFWNTPAVNPDPCGNPDPCANPCSGNAFVGGFDSRVIFDQFSRRFILIRTRNGGELFPPPGDLSHLYLAVSKGFDEEPNDPIDIDSWDKFLIETRTCDNTGACTQRDFHFPGLAVTEEAICVTTIQTTKTPGHVGSSLHAFRRPPVNAPPTYYAGGANYKSLQIPLNSTEPFPIGSFQHLPMPAHVFGSVGADTVYMAQVQEWKSPATNPPSGTIRVLAVTDPLGVPNLHSKRFSLSQEIHSNARHLEELCNPEALVNFWKPSFKNVQNCAWRNGHLYFAFEDDLQDGDDDFRRVALRWFDVNLNGWPAQNVTLQPCARVLAGSGGSAPVWT
jgi:hypothetical protein